MGDQVSDATVSAAQRRGNAAWIVASLSLLACFSGVTATLIAYGVFAFDVPVMGSIHGAASAPADAVMRAISRLGQWRGVVPLDLAVFVYFCLRRRWAHARFWAACVGGAGLLDVVAKQLLARARPELWTPFAPETSFSFPSGHAMASMAMMATLSVVLWPSRWRYPMLGFGALFVATMGLSRIYLGVHYPSDVLAGWALALAWVLAVAALLRPPSD